MRPNTTRTLAGLTLLASLAFFVASPDAAAQEVKERAVEAARGVAIKARKEGPSTAEVPLQVICYFRDTRERARRMAGAPVELDKELGGVIAALRERGEFEGDAFETLLLVPPKGSIKAKALLLIGLGEDGSLSLARMEQVGRVALREASRLGVRKVAFAPLIRDQGNTKFGICNVAAAVVKGVLLAYDTERRLQDRGLAARWLLTDWEVEAGPAYFDETVAGVKRAVVEAALIAAGRKSTPLPRKK